MEAYEYCFVLYIVDYSSLKMCLYNANKFAQIIQIKSCIFWIRKWLCDESQVYESTRPSPSSLRECDLWTFHYIPMLVTLESKHTKSKPLYYLRNTCFFLSDIQIQQHTNIQHISSIQIKARNFYSTFILFIKFYLFYFGSVTHFSDFIPLNQNIIGLFIHVRTYSYWSSTYYSRVRRLKLTLWVNNSFFLSFPLLSSEPFSQNQMYLSLLSIWLRIRAPQPRPLLTG